MKLFGTDGVRGRFGYSPITPQTMLQFGWAIGTVLGSSSNQRSEILIGKDTRVSGYVIESALESGLLSAGVDIGFLGPVPTPAVSYFCRQTNAIAGIVISASHNPVQDNGIKILLANGRKLPDHFQNKIEEQMENPMDVVSSYDLGKARRIDEPVESYADYICRSSGVDLSGLRIVVDCANGASYRVAPMVLSKLGADVIPVADQPDGFNINLDCGSTNPEYIQSMTLQHEADVGIALDGDGDRVMMVDDDGNLVNGDQILFVIAMRRKRDRVLNGGVVGTQLSNMGLETALTNNDIPFERVEIGDRYISARMMERGWTLGGETCGHIMNGEAGVSGDGIVGALEVLAEMQQSGKSLKSLVSGVTLEPNVSKNVELPELNAPLNGLNIKVWKETHAAIESAEEELSQNGRVLIRPSGTEPVIRVFVEGHHQDKINRIADTLVDVVRHEARRVLSSAL